MNCDPALKLIPLYYYGELPPHEEDLLEDHLHICQGCSRALQQQRAVAAVLEGSREEAPEDLLEGCRAELWQTISSGPPAPPAPVRGPWRLFFQALGESFSSLGRLRQPVGALALLLIGFVAARVTTVGPRPDQPDQMVKTVRSVQPDGAGGVRISFDETQRRSIAGRMDDRNIQQLLLAGVREENPAVRVESMGLLKDRADSSAVRDMLLNSLAHDPNAGVRLKAAEGLKPLAGDPAVRKVLAQVLLTDDTAAVRMRVVDLLTSHPDDEMVGVLQDLMEKESNDYVRLKSEQALKGMNASIGTF
jgi:hypothetical protein